MTPRRKRQRYRTNAAKLAKKLRIDFDPQNWEQIWSLIDEHGEPDYLYVVADFRNRMVKFGRSRNPGARLGTLNTGNGTKLELWGFCPHVSPFTEKEVHERLKAFRLTGEWFRLAIPVQSVVNDVRAAGRTAT